VSLYFLNSASLFAIAKDAANNAFENERKGPLIATIFAVISAEAFINEALEFASEIILDKEPGASKIKAFAAIAGDIAESQGSLAQKYQIAKWVFSGEPFDKGARPYQDFVDLIAARNAIIHSKPVDKYDVNEKGETVLVSPNRIIERFKKRDVMWVALDNDQVPWTYKLFTPQMANWSCDVARTMVETIASLPPNGGFGTQLMQLARGFQIK
jgi:hypothetical protein